MIILQDKIPLKVLQKAYETSICQNLLNVFKDEVENCREAALDLVVELVVGQRVDSCTQMIQKIIRLAYNFLSRMWIYTLCCLLDCILVPIHATWHSQRTFLHCYFFPQAT